MIIQANDNVIDIDNTNLIVMCKSGRFVSIAVDISVVFALFTEGPVVDGFTDGLSASGRGGGDVSDTISTSFFDFNFDFDL